jgi:NADH-ubiquinone oxidoreductase chain 2
MLTLGTIIGVLLRTITKSSELFTRLTIGMVSISTVLSFQTYTLSPSGSISILGGLFHTNMLINGTEFYILIASTLLIFLPHVKADNFGAEYKIILIFSICGALALGHSYDMISTFLAIELQSLSFYVIASIARKESTAAGLKYFLLGSLSSAFFLFGLVSIYSLTGITQYDGIVMIYTTSTTFSGHFFDLFNFGLLFIAIGLLFKIGAAPFHNWAPDVYDNVPTNVTSWLAIMGKLSILSFLFILKTSFSLDSAFSSLSTAALQPSLIIFSATLSLLIGSILGIVQYRIKRLLAYSSIGHLGYLLITLSIDSGIAISSFLFYMLQYWLSLICIFAILLHCEQNSSSLNTVSALRYYTIKNPALIFVIIINFFSLTGIPPLIGFFGKQMVLHTLLEHGYYLTAIIAVVSSVISATYYLRIVTNSLSISGDGIFKFSPDTLENSSSVGSVVLSSPSPSSLSISSWIISVISLAILSVFQSPRLCLNISHSLAFSILGS